MGLLEVVLIGVAGFGAGFINAIVGSGTLVTFPTLVAFGVPPVTANISNGIGLIFGGVASTLGYRRELAGQTRRVLRLAVATTIGAVIGALLLLVLPSSVFATVVPVLILIGIILVILQPAVARWVARRHSSRPADDLPGSPEDAPEDTRRRDAPWAWPATGLVGMYCGYFGAAQGVLLIGILGITIDDAIQRLNAVKNLLSTIGNAVAGLVFMTVAFGRIDWQVVLIIAVGSVVGGLVGARVGRVLPAWILRAVIVTVGLIAIAVMLGGGA